MMNPTGFQVNVQQVSLIPGPQGPQGIQGPAGPSGGVQGPQGIQGIPGAVASTLTINGHMLSNNITLAAADVGAVPTSRQVNGHSLGNDIILSAADVSAVPTGFQINGTPLSGSSINLSPSTLGVPSGSGTSTGTNTGDQTLAGLGAMASNITINGNVLSGNTASNINITPAIIGSPSGSGTCYGANTGDQTSIIGNAGTVTHATLTTALTVNTGTVTIQGDPSNTSVLTLPSGSSAIPMPATGAAIKAGTDNTGYATASNLNVAGCVFGASPVAIGSTTPNTVSGFNSEISVPYGSLTASQMAGTILDNYSMPNSTCNILLPACAAGYSFIWVLSVVQYQKCLLTCIGTDVIYLYSGGSVTVGASPSIVGVEPGYTAGTAISVFTFKNSAGGYSWGMIPMAGTWVFNP